MHTNKKGLLSICCLGYNHARFIPAAIEAMWKFNDPNIEIIAVDDGSSDGSPELLQKLAEKSPVPMKLILQKNTGNVGKNFNTAFKQAEGEFVIFVSLDDMLYAPNTTKHLQRMRQNDTLAFTGSSKNITIDANGNRGQEITLPLSSMKNVSLNDLLELEYNFGSFFIQNAIFRKDIVEQAGAFDEDMTGDDIVLRTKIFRYMLLNQEKDFAIVNDEFCLYRQHGANVHLNGPRQIKIVTEYLERYWPDRPAPSVLYDWAEGILNNEPYAKIWDIFALNKRAASLLASKRIQRVLIKRIQKETSPWRFIYKKEKIHNTRTITLFSCFRFTYKHKR